MANMLLLIGEFEIAIFTINSLVEKVDNMHNRWGI